jgi:hypothetical protein
MVDKASARNPWNPRHGYGFAKGLDFRTHTCTCEYPWGLPARVSKPLVISRDRDKANNASTITTTYTTNRQPSTCYQPCEQLLTGWIVGVSRQQWTTPQHQQLTQCRMMMNHARNQCTDTLNSAITSASAWQWQWGPSKQGWWVVMVMGWWATTTSLTPAVSLGFYLILCLFIIQCMILWYIICSVLDYT